MSEQPIETRLGRRGMIRGGAIGGAATLLAAATGTARAAAVAPPPVNDKDFADFSLIKINSDDDSLAKIQKKGLVVGTSNDWPYSFLDPKTNEWTGLDADFIRYACKMLNIDKITVQTVTFDGLIPGLLDGRFDIVGDSIHYTKNRSKVVNFCFPNYYYAEALVVPAGNPHNLHQLADLKGYTVGTLLGTNYAEWLQARAGGEVPGLQGLGADCSGTGDRAYRCRAVRSAGGGRFDEAASGVEDRDRTGLRAAHVQESGRLQQLCLPPGRYPMGQRDVVGVSLDGGTTRRRTFSRSGGLAEYNN